ncbi:MAG: sugar ABC transporter permease [Anaerolineales bacterium]|nr:sugar ABC transporter permease [Anaerolineales bacterium]
MKSTRTGWGFITPTLIILGITGVLPFIYVIYVGFFDWNVFAAQKGLHFTWANNYRRLVFDPDFLGALWRTLLFTIWTVTSELILGFALAQSLTRDFPGKSFFRTIHALPLMIAPIAVGATWRLLTIPGLGLIPAYLQWWFGIDYRIGNFANQAFLTVVLMDIWHWTPFVTLTLLAGLTTIPKEPLEQALVDGANRWQVFRYLTIPMMMPVILTTVFIRIMDALRIVDEVWMLTAGGPGDATRFIGLHIWRVVFPKTDYGYGSAMSLLTLYFTLVLCWLLFIAIGQNSKQNSSS